MGQNKPFLLLDFKGKSNPSPKGKEAPRGNWLEKGAKQLAATQDGDRATLLACKGQACTDPHENAAPSGSLRTTQFLSFGQKRASPETHGVIRRGAAKWSTNGSRAFDLARRLSLWGRFRIRANGIQGSSQGGIRPACRRRLAAAPRPSKCHAPILSNPSTVVKQTAKHLKQTHTHTHTHMFFHSAKSPKNQIE